jgi:hypothetical protein
MTLTLALRWTKAKREWGSFEDATIYAFSKAASSPQKQKKHPSVHFEFVTKCDSS